MEPVGMVLGQSAATAAVQAIEADYSVQDVDYPKLKEQLIKDGQILKNDQDGEAMERPNPMPAQP
jgi:hypothetical protein